VNARGASRKPGRGPVGRRASPRRVGWIVALALAGAGCAPLASGPSRATPPRLTRSRTRPQPGEAAPRAAGGATAVTRTPMAIAQATHEYPGPPVRQTASAPAGNPVSAVEAFAAAYINWNARSVAQDMGRLAARSIGQARSAMQLAAIQTAQDYELARAGVANEGAVEAIGPVLGRPGQYAVVTLERTTASDSTAYAGLGAAWHVAVATVTRVAPARWVLSGWQPEN
jgi:hypothetical protein